MEDIDKSIIVRATLVCVLVLFAGLIIVLKIAYIQMARGEELRGIADKLEYKQTALPSYRGTIFSADGKALATYKPYYSISFDATVVKNIVFEKELGALCDSLARFPGNFSSSEYKKLIQNSRRDKIASFMITRGATLFDYEGKLRLSHYPIFNLGKGRGGFVVSTQWRRAYPYGNLFHRTIGEQNPEKSRYYGLENAFDSVLCGVDGVEMKRNMGTEFVPVHSTKNRPAINGKDIVTTIDIDIQDYADYALRNKLNETNADWGCVVVMEVATGEIKAMVNLKSEKNGYFENFNYAIAERFEPGSTMKMVSFLALMDKGFITDLDAPYDLQYVVHKDDRQSRFIGDWITDDHALGEKGNGKTTVRAILEQSSNVGTASLVCDAYSKNPQDFLNFICSIPLDKPQRLNLAGEQNPYFRHPSPAQWKNEPTLLPWMAYGYGPLMTPLQILTFYNALANNGMMMKPILVKEIVKNGIVTTQFDTEIINPQIASPTAIAKAHELLEGVVKRGTGKTLSSKKYTVSMAGKTGTAQIFNPKNKTYLWSNPVTGAMDKRYYNSTFVGYFPADKPKYSCIVVISKPKIGSYGGGAVCAPVFGEIAQNIYSTKLTDNVEPNRAKIKANCSDVDLAPVYLPDLREYCDEFDISYTDKRVKSEWVMPKILKNNVLDFKEIKYKNDVVPNLNGMTAADAVCLLENMGWRVRIKGYGLVKEQNPEQGTVLSKGNVVELILN